MRASIAAFASILLASFGLLVSFPAAADDTPPAEAPRGPAPAQDFTLDPVAEPEEAPLEPAPDDGLAALGPGAADDPDASAPQSDGGGKSISPGFLFSLVAPAIPFAIIAVAGAAAGVGVGLAIGLRRRAHSASKTPAAPKALSIEEAVKHLASNPLDAIAQFTVGLDQLSRGAPEGVRHLEYAFRLNPMLILPLLGDPKLAPVREQTEVRRLLARIHNDRQQKALTGYA